METVAVITRNMKEALFTCSGIKLAEDTGGKVLVCTCVCVCVCVQLTHAGLVVMTPAK